jgi:hypothetical protein
MTRRTAAPFHRLDAAVRADPWMITLGGGAPALLRDITHDWDYATPATVDRVIAVDAAAAAAELGFAEGEALSLEVVVEVGTGPGDLPREIVARERISLGGALSLPVTLQLDPARLSAQLSLRTAILLANDARPADALAPRLAGTRLWDDRVQSRIEGDDPRFPMEVVSFWKTFPDRPHEAAPWLLSWSPGSPGRDFHGAARLFVNADDDLLIARLDEGDELTLQAIMGDVVSQMCEAALTGGWDEDLDGAEPGSVAGRVSHWLERAFGDVAVARGLLENRPGEFRAAILASMRL